jgi:sulfatase modifying factor 1
MIHGRASYLFAPVVMVGLALAAGACLLVKDLDGYTGPTDTAVGCGIAGRGPAMIRDGNLCVDGTEVTQVQYDDFVQSKKGEVSGQDPECSWNATYAPFPDGTGAAKCVYAPGGAERDQPVGGVDWCDAVAFCRWAGKHLCSADEWAAACTHYGDGAHAFPYGSQYAPGCNVAEAGVGRPRRVASSMACQGPFPGLYDMSGNVLEWTTACEGTNRTDSCETRGGSFLSGPPQASCAGSYKVARDSNMQCQLGFRCCATPSR